MYVMSSLPSAEQSVAGGIFNTISKLCNNLGLGIATSVYTSRSSQLGDGGSAIEPYLSVYWFAAACAGLSPFLVPFLTIGTQGNHQSSEKRSSTADLVEDSNGVGSLEERK